MHKFLILIENKDIFLSLSMLKYLIIAIFKN